MILLSLHCWSPFRITKLLDLWRNWEVSRVLRTSECITPKPTKVIQHQSVLVLQGLWWLGKMHRIQKSNLTKHEPWEWITGGRGRLSGVRKWLLNGYLPFGRDEEENECLQLYFYINLRMHCTGSVSKRQQAQPKALGKLYGTEKGCVKSIM